MALDRWSRAVLLVLCVGYSAAALLIRPSIGVDPAYSLRVYQSAQAGAAWNHLIEPDVGDLSRDRASFFAMFSPGAYLVPGLLMSMGLSMGAAATLVSIAATLLGLIGWFRLYREFAFDRITATLACTALAASRSVNLAFITYLGGEVLAFAVFPFLACAAWRRRDSRWLPLLAAMAVVVAFTAKNSLAIYMTGWLIAQSAVALLDRRRSDRRVAAPLLAVGAAVTMMAVIHVLFVMRGWSPLSYQPSIALSARPYVLPWAMPVLAATSWDDLLSWVFLHPSGAIWPFDYRNSVVFLALIASGSLVAAVLAMTRQRHPHVRQVFLYSIVTVGGLMTLMASGAVASLDLARHYRVIGYAWLPFIVQAALTARPVMAVILAGVLALPGVYGIGSFAANWRRHYAARDSQSERLHITHPQVTPRIARALQVLDRDLPDGTVVVTPVPTYALEFLRTRALATNIVADEIRQVRVHHGRAANLIVIADRRAMTPGKQQAWLATFDGYDRWESLDVDDHRFYVPAGQPVNPSWLEAAIK
jgi:hypothetical protein